VGASSIWRVRQREAADDFEAVLYDKRPARRVATRSGEQVSHLDTLHRRVSVLGFERNAQPCTIRWQFTTSDARTRLHDLYPTVQTNMD
jgi:hypothetical protein